MEMPQDLISPRQAARLARSHIGTIYRWIADGKLRAWRRGGSRYLVSEADVRGMLVEVKPVKMPDSAAEFRRRQEVAKAVLRSRGIKC